MKTIGVGIVGCGRISDLHELGYRGRSDARIVAVCDINGELAESKAKLWGVGKVYTDYSKMLLDSEVDMVELLLPHYLHCSMTVQACQAGKHVSVQKPMANSVKEADQMIAAAKKANVMLRIYETLIFYPPAVKAKEMIMAGEIGEPQMLRMHVSTGKAECGWEIPIDAWIWRFEEEKCGGGPMVFDHGYHLFSLAYSLMGPVEKVFAWIDSTSLVQGVNLDAPAVIMFKFKGDRRYGVFDVEHTPNTYMPSDYYVDDDRIEIIGDKGMIFINRYTTKAVDLPEVVLYRDGKTTPVPVPRVEWADGFIDCTRNMIDMLQSGGQAALDGETGKAVLQFSLAVQQSAKTGREVRPDELK